MNIFACLKIPRRNVVENAIPFDIPADKFHVCLLCWVLLLLPHKRRIAEDVAALGGREDFLPVLAQRVGHMDVRAAAQRDAAVELGEGHAERHVRLMVGEPERDFGDAGGEFLDLDAEHLVHVDEGEIEDFGLAHLLLAGVEFEEDFQFQGAQLAVGDDEEIATATGGVEEAQGGDLFLEGDEALAFADLEFFRAVELGAEVVEEQGADDFEDVALGGVVRADPPAFLRIHHRLKERAEDGGRDGVPFKSATGEELRAHGAGERGQREAFGKEQAVDVGELEQVGSEMFLAAVFGGVEHLEQFVELGAEVGAVGGGVVLEIELERIW